MTRALLIIDMQRWMFRHPARQPQLPGLIRVINDVAGRFADKGLPIYHIVTQHQLDRSTWSRLMQKYDYPCLLEGSDEGAAVHGLSLPEAAEVCVKTANDVFLNTDLEDLLKRQSIERLYLTGVFMDGCVGLSAAGAAQRGFEVAIIRDGYGVIEAERAGVILDWLCRDYEMQAPASAELDI